MTHQLTESRPRRRPSAGALSLIEVLVLAPLAALLAFWLIPKVFGVEWSCVSGSGVGNTAGDSSFCWSICWIGGGSSALSRSAASSAFGKSIAPTMRSGTPCAISGLPCPSWVSASTNSMRCVS